METSETTTKKPSKTLAGALMLGLLMVAGLGFWRLAADIAHGQIVKAIVIGGIAAFGGLRAYKKAQDSAHS